MKSKFILFVFVFFLTAEIALAQSSAPAEDEEVAFRLLQGETIALPVTDLIDERSRQPVPCLANADLITAFRRLDPESVATWETLNSILRYEIQKQRFSFFLHYNHMVANESLIPLKYSLKTFGGEVYVPVSSVRRLAKFLEGLDLVVPETVIQREAASPAPPERSDTPATASLAMPLLPQPTDNEIRATGPKTGETGFQPRLRGDAEKVIFEIGGIYYLGVSDERKEELALLYSEIARRCGEVLSANLGVDYEVADPKGAAKAEDRLNQISHQNPDLVILLQPGYSRFAAVNGIRIYFPSNLFDQAPQGLSAPEAGDRETGLPPRDLLYLRAHPRTMQLVRNLQTIFQRSPIIQNVETQPAPLFIARRLEVPAILIEFGYCTNTQNAAHLKTESDYFARMLAQGMINFYRQ